MSVLDVNPAGKMTLDEIRRDAVENAKIHLQANAELVFARGIIEGVIDTNFVLNKCKVFQW